MLEGVNKSIDVQIKVLKEILFKNEKLVETLKILEEYAKVNPKFKDYYVGAGGVNQTVFNYYHGYDINYGIKDFDIVYYDSDESYEAEDLIIKDLEKQKLCYLYNLLLTLKKLFMQNGKLILMDTMLLIKQADILLLQSVLLP